MLAAGRRQASKLSTGIGLLLLAISVVALLAVDVGADTAGSPDTNTKAAPAPATPNLNPPGPIDNAVEGTPVNIHVDGEPGKFFGVNAARMCRSGLNVTTSSQMSPTSFGNCVPKPFVGASDDDPNRQDDSFMQVSASPANTSVDFTFRVGSGSQTFDYSGGSSTITCDATHPCAIWLWQSVDPSIKAGGSIFKHFDINYAGGGASTTTSTTTSSSTTSSTAPTTTSSTAPTTTSSTAPTTTSSTAPTTTSSTAPSTTSSTAPTTTSSTAPTTTSSTAPTTTSSTAPTTTSSTAPTTTSSTASSTTSTTSDASTTSTTAGTGTTTSTTAASGGSVSPASASTDGSFTITSSGWQGSVNVIFRSDPVTLGALTADSTGTIRGTFTVPNGATPGQHTIELSGTGSNGSPRTLSIPFTVLARGATGGSTLPRTGAGIIVMAWIGAILFLAGAALLGGTARIPGAHYKS